MLSMFNISWQECTPVVSIKMLAVNISANLDTFTFADDEGFVL